MHCLTLGRPKNERGACSARNSDSIKKEKESISLRYRLVNFEEAKLCLCVSWAQIGIIKEGDRKVVD